MTLPVLDLETIRAAATRDLVFAAVRDGFVAHAEGRTQVLPPVHLAFADADGDCHVKVGHLAGSPHFTVKISTGFYRNPRIGLPTNNGTMVVLDAATGAPLAVLADDGWLTAWRTAAAGALITNALTPVEVDEVGVLGTGLQARLQTEWLHALRPLTRVNIWGRRPDAARQLCADLQNIGIDARSLGLDEAAGAACVITATTATAPLAPATAFDTAQHITAVGADMPGKNELPPELFSRATLIATDDHAQCLDHGDFGNAVRAGHATADSDVAIGALLGSGAVVRSGLSIADLTGIGALDAALASAVVNRLGIGRTTPMPDAIHVQAADQRLRMPAQVGRSSENLENT